jgi:hypothetical protein
MTSQFPYPSYYRGSLPLLARESPAQQLLCTDLSKQHSVERLAAGRSFGLGLEPHTGSSGSLVRRGQRRDAKNKLGKRHYLLGNCWERKEHQGAIAMDRQIRLKLPAVSSRGTLEEEGAKSESVSRCPCSLSRSSSVLGPH